MARLKTLEAEFVDQLTVMVQKMNAGLLTPSGITSAEWNAVQTALPELVTAIQEANQARVAAIAATSKKEARAQSLRTLVQGFVDKIYASPQVTDEQLNSVGLSPRPPRVLPSLPKSVAGLVAKVLESGAVRLNWKRNGNTANTLYEIQVDTGSGFTLLTVTRTIRFTDDITPLGQARAYRVVAFNSLGRALPSTIVKVFGEQETNPLSLAA